MQNTIPKLESRPYYTLDQVAAYFCVHRSTVNRWIKEDQLKAIKLSPHKMGAIRISHDSLKTFIRDRELD